MALDIRLMRTILHIGAGPPGPDTGDDAVKPLNSGAFEVIGAEGAGKKLPERPFADPALLRITDENF